MSNKSGITQYIDLTEQTNEERLDEFARTIDLALDSYDRKKYGVHVLADIVAVACNKIVDMFDVNDIFEIGQAKGDCVVRTSAYLPKDEEGFYSLFVDDVKESNEKYKRQEIDVQEFFVDLILAKENLSENLQPKGFVLVKKNSEN